MERIIFHIDVNSAYLSWSALEKLKNNEDKVPVDLRLIPSIIGGDMERRHGVVLAKSIPAKAYGVSTGEPIVNALRKCPHLTLEPPDHTLYSRRSRELMELLEKFSPDLEQVSVDECYMDYSPIASKYPTPEQAAAQIKGTIRERFGYTVNIGISDRKVLAKMASDFKKPDRVHTLYSWEIKEKMWPLPVSSLYMCGKSSVETLRKLEILTIGDLAAADPEILSAHLKSHGLLLWQYANGINEAAVETVAADAKGIGNSTTLKEDAVTRQAAVNALLHLSESVSSRLRHAGQAAGMISVELKYNTFRSVSHQTTLETPTHTTEIIYKTACALFDELWDGAPIRLLGVRTSKLSSGADPVQLSLFDYQTSQAAGVADKKTDSNARLQKLDQALDAIRGKYGSDAVVRGSLLKTKDDYKKH